MHYFETTDPELTSQTLNEVYGNIRLTVEEGRHRFRITQRPVGPVELQHVEFTTMRFTGDIEPLGHNLVCRSVGGELRYSNARRSNDWIRGDTFLVAQPDEHVSVMMHGLAVDVAVISPDLLAQVAATAPGRSSEPVRLQGYSAISPAGAARWSKTYDFVNDHIAGTSADVQPLIAGAAARLLAATALTVFPSNALTDPTIEDRRDAHPASLRRAVAFIEANPHRDVTAADIAAAAHVTIRSLQLAFRRHLDTTPMAYLRRVRLHHAHLELQAADPTTGETVSAIAARWGFADHSRFTAAYHATYGRPPSRTLRS